MEQEFCLSGEVTTSTDPGPSPGDRLTSQHTRCPLPATLGAPDLSGPTVLWGVTSAQCLLPLTLLTPSWFGISLRLLNPAQPRTSDFGTFPTPWASTSYSSILPSASSSAAEHAGATQRLNLFQHLQEAHNFCASSQTLHHSCQQSIRMLKLPQKAPVLVSGL